MTEVTKQQLIDLGGQINADIKQKEKDLDKIKKQLRTMMKEDGTEKDHGDNFSLTAGEYVQTIINAPGAFKAITGIAPSDVRAEDTIEIKGEALLDLIRCVSYKMPELKKIFMDETLEDFVETKKTPFHTLTFKKRD